ncbi:MAG: efflux RND transporter periplasmic adaptor subunit [Pseudomonadota bacterium]
MGRTTALATLIALSLTSGAYAQDGAPAAAPLPGVGYVVAEERDVTPSVEFVGRIEAVSRVALRARVTGFLEEQKFEDGDLVKTGDVLFIIEQAPFAAAVKQAEANLAAAKATAENATIALSRAETLLERDTVAQATVDDRLAEKRVADASVLQADAALDQERITFSYTQITAPIDGQIGRASIKPGNLVSPDSGVLTNIVQQDPMFVTFNVTERTALQLRRALAESDQDFDLVSQRVTLRLRLSDGEMYDKTGTLDFSDVQVNPGTDTIVFRGVVPNPDGILVDQQFIIVVVETSEPERHVVIPESAISVDQRGRFVLIVNDANEVEEQFVDVGDAVPGGVPVEKGLDAGAKVIVDGLMKVRPGMKVDAVPADDGQA